MAKATGLAPATIHNIWREHGLKPCRVASFKLSSDPTFVEMAHDIVGGYVDVPERALVLSVGERSLLQASGRTPEGCR